jgi:hypothetical protein
MSRWLHLAAAPTFVVMALVTAAQDRGMPLCSTGDVLGLSGMTPMYVLMAVFHLTPWLKLMSRRHSPASA